MYTLRMKKLLLWTATFSWAYLIIYLTSIPSPKVTDDYLISFIISSGVHFFLFGVQAILLYFSLPKKILTLSRTVVSITLCSLFGLWGELHQLTLQSRTADPIDWAVDTLGAIIFLGILIKITTKKNNEDKL